MVYVEMGKNKILGTGKKKILEVVLDLLDNNKKLIEMKKIRVPIKHKASESIVLILKNRGLSS